MPPLNTRKCPLCQQETSRSHEFCDHCGRGIGDYCLECGAERSRNGTFCVKCGSEFKPLPTPPPGAKQSANQQPEIPTEEGSSTPFFPVWFKRLFLGALILFVVFGLGLWLTVWFMRQWAEMRSGDPETAPVATVAPHATESRAPAHGLPIVIPDTLPTFSRDSRWQARFEHWYVVYLPQFTPLSPGSLLEVETRTGIRMTGTLTSVSNRLITINREGMEIGFEASQLTLSTLSHLFREEYAQNQAAMEVEREQRNEGQNRPLRTVAATRTAQRPDLNPGSKPGVTPPAAPQTEFQTDLATFKQSMLRLVISLLVIVGVVVVVRHLW
jgi:hypothetical protein